ncbi:transcriptional regulator [Ensifer adhaerens]|uniref:transcriptional regulator n=1 Tax=Ensifer adhaerens TaxID=106592 RepID=UPI0023A92A6A|nr:transcriptional regulator [Ensifer adhaerens]WDZ79032.1 transcriptional regulator [Ensifer adhaerens]
MIGAALQKINKGDAVSINELITLAKATGMTDLSPDAVAWRRYEQTRPRHEIPFDPEKHGALVGAFQLDNGDVLTVRLRENVLSAQMAGQSAVDIYPEARDAFFYRVVDAQLTFERDGAGCAASVVLHQHGHELTAKRIDETTAQALADGLEKRVKEKIPFPNSEHLLRRIISEHQRGMPDYEAMIAPLAELARQQAQAIKADFERLGPLQSLTFKGVLSDGGWDVYDVRFAEGALGCGFTLAANGKFSGIYFRPAL